MTRSAKRARAHDPGDGARSSARPPWIVRYRSPLALIALATLFYVPALRAGYIWDDGVLTANPLVAQPSGLRTLWLEPYRNVHEPHYWPLVYTTFWLEYRLWELHPLGYHLDNILLHALCVLLLWRVLLDVRVPHAWLGAALFAVHPVHVESVAWVAERKDVLSGALYLGSALAYLRFDETRRRTLYALALVLFTLAMLSKSIVVTLPFSLALALWWKKGRLTARDLAPLVPFTIIGAALTAFDLWLFYGLSESGHLTLTLLQRLQLAGRAFWFYPGKLLWPHPLAALYPKWTVDPASPWRWWPLPLALGLFSALWVPRRRIGIGPVVAAMGYAVAIAPALGLVPHGFMAYAWVADRFQYLPSMALLALLGAFLGRLASGPQLFRGVTPALLLFLGALTWRQSGLYRDHITLFRYSSDAYPEGWQARAQLSGGLARAGRHAEACAELVQVLRQDPDERHTIHLELGAMQTNLGQLKEAEENIEAALRLVPEYAEARYELGRVRERQGRRAEALTYYRQALAQKPYFRPAEDALQRLLTGSAP
jgi:hypothetical protein